MPAFEGVRPAVDMFASLLCARASVLQVPLSGFHVESNAVMLRSLQFLLRFQCLLRDADGIEGTSIEKPGHTSIGGAECVLPRIGVISRPYRDAWRYQLRREWLWLRLQYRCLGRVLRGISQNPLVGAARSITFVHGPLAAAVRAS